MSSTDNPLATQEHFERRFRIAGVPERFMSFVNEPQDDRWARWMKAREAVFKVIADGGIVAMCGNRGPGKTQIACECAMEWMHGNGTAIYTTALEFFVHLRSPMHTGKESEGDVLKRYTSAGLLVLDEVHERGNSLWEDRLMTHVIDKRYANRRGTILISNQTPEAFRAQIGESAWDRLSETGGIVRCEWESFRTRPPVRVMSSKQA